MWSACAPCGNRNNGVEFFTQVGYLVDGNGAIAFLLRLFLGFASISGCGRESVNLAAMFFGCLCCTLFAFFRSTGVHLFGLFLTQQVFELVGV